jgi:hypothetical protein
LRESDDASDKKTAEHPAKRRHLLRESDDTADKEIAKHPAKRRHRLRESDDATDKEIVKATYKAAPPLYRNLACFKKSSPQICVISSK